LAVRESHPLGVCGFVWTHVHYRSADTFGWLAEVASHLGVQPSEMLKSTRVLLARSRASKGFLYFHDDAGELTTLVEALKSTVSTARWPPGHATA
jgi:hypothetical protein